MKTIKNTLVSLMAFFLFTGPVFSGDLKKTSPDTVKESYPEPLSVSFLGEDHDYLYFQVAISAGNKKVFFEVTDEDEGKLYSKQFSSNTVKIYKIEKREGQELDFNLKDGIRNFSWSFSESNKASYIRL